MRRALILDNVMVNVILTKVASYTTIFIIIIKINRHFKYDLISYCMVWYNDSDIVTGHKGCKAVSTMTVNINGPNGK